MKLFLKIVLVYALSSTLVFANVDFNKVGQAKMQYLFWDVYDATLYTPSGSYKSEQMPVKFTLTYLRDFKAKDIVKATKEQWRHLGKTELDALYSAKLLQMWPNIKKGESLTLQTNEQGISVFFHNNEMIGQIDDTRFANEFLAIWLSEKTSEPTLRKQLLGIN